MYKKIQKFYKSLKCLLQILKGHLEQTIQEFSAIHVPAQVHVPSVLGGGGAAGEKGDFTKVWTWNSWQAKFTMKNNRLGGGGGHWSFSLYQFQFEF